MAKAPAPEKLTPRQDAFASEYLVDLNGKQAAIRAGYAEKGAEVTASKLLRIPKVKTAVETALAARAGALQIKSEDVLRELHHLAFVDIGELFDSKSGKLRPLHELPVEVRRAISAVKLGEDGKPSELKLYNKVHTLELLGKHLALWINDKNNAPPPAPVTVNVNTQVINEAPDPKRSIQVLQILSRAGALPFGAQDVAPDDDAEDDEVHGAAANGAPDRAPTRKR